MCLVKVDGRSNWDGLLVGLRWKLGQVKMYGLSSCDAEFVQSNYNADPVKMLSFFKSRCIGWLNLDPFLGWVEIHLNWVKIKL